MPRWLRALIPAVLALAWLATAGLGGPAFGQIQDVSSNDRALQLPASAEATQVQKLEDGFRSAEVIPAILVYERSGGLTDADRQAIESDVDAVKGLTGVEADSVSPAIASDDGEAAQVIVPIETAGESEASDTVTEIRSYLADNARDGLSVYVTGPAGQTADLVDAFAGIDGLLLLVALAAVFVILIIVYRSPMLPFIVLGTSVFALTARRCWWSWRSRRPGSLLLSGQTQGILFILVIGAATDYSLLYVARYREALRDHAKRWDATWVALQGLLRADPRLGRHGDRRPAHPAAQRPRLEQVARPGCGDRHRLCAARRAEPAPVDHAGGRPGGILAAEARLRVTASRISTGTGRANCGRGSAGSSPVDRGSFGASPRWCWSSPRSACSP